MGAHLYADLDPSEELELMFGYQLGKRDEESNLQCRQAMVRQTISTPSQRPVVGLFAQIRLTKLPLDPGG